MRKVSEKILSLAESETLAAKFRAEGKSVVLCHGVFDLLHPGHIRHFQEAKSLGDYLFVSLTADAHVNKGPGRPMFPQGLRAETLASLAAVDFVLISQAPTAVEVIESLKPSLYVKGQDYENRASDVTRGIYKEEAAVEAGGGKIHFTHDITFSSTQILNSHFGVYPEAARSFLKQLRQVVSADEVVQQLENLKGLKVLVIGDTIVDEYHYCQPLGKSPKETILTTKFLNEEAFPGGILACANHIAAFAGSVHLVTCLGEQNSRQELIESQLKSNVEAKFFYRPDAPTVIKRRYVEPAFLTKMFQVAYLTDTDVPVEVSGAMVRYLREVAPQYDVVVVADYGHGCIDRSLRETLVDRSKFLALNVQTNSANQGYNLVTKYPAAHYVCIDEPELRLAMQDKYGPVRDVVAQLSRHFASAQLTVTRGHNGSITATREGEAIHYFESPSVSSKIVDRVGAGDAYFAATALLAANHAKPEIIGLVGNAVGAMAVEVVCNRSALEAAPLYKFIKALLG